MVAASKLILSPFNRTGLFKITINLAKSHKQIDQIKFLPRELLESKNLTKTCLPNFSTNFSNNTNNNHKTNNNPSNNRSKLMLLIFGILGTAYYKINQSKSYCQEATSHSNNDEPPVEAGKFIEGLETYTQEELEKHGKNSETIWVSYKNGVYDITDFVESHPGGKKILMAAGSSLEPFWNIYAVHNTNETFELLEAYRIGNLKIDKEKHSKNVETLKDPFQNDPKRHPLLTVLSSKPFNAETPKELSVESLLTPNELFFVRNHLPVPEIDLNNYEIEIVDVLNGKTLKFNLDEIKTKFQTYTIPVTIQCSGNKRKYMNEYEPVQGLMWDVNAISTAEWTGVKLKDLLSYCKIDFQDERIKHVHFEGLDRDPTGSTYSASIPKEKAFDDNGDVLIAFKMNGEEIPPDHGFPLRVVVPGIIGARSVKWLNKIIISDKESESHWQKNDYKRILPSIKNLKDANFAEYKAIQESPVQSAICDPVDGRVVKKTRGKFLVKGYAFSGGGKHIDDVIVSIDGGQNWKKATLNQIESPMNKSWAWALWHYEVDIPKDKDNLEIICVATDSSQNTQPESYKTIWNARGLLNNAWHKINVKLV